MSEERHPNNLVAMVLALVPGLSQVYLEHVLLGAIFFSAFLTALNCLFLASNLQSATNTQLLGQISILSLIVIWIGSAWHAYALSYGTDRSGLARDRGQLLRLALLDYLRNDLEPAAIKLERAIELDVDWQDPDPLFHLGVVLLRLAEERALDQDPDGSRVARRRSQWAFRTCLGRDRFGKWRREIRRETRRMRTLLQSSGRGTSERLTAEDDTTLASFPELGESTALPRPPLGPDSSRYPRITPRPFSRRILKERLEASGLEDDTVAAMPPEEEASEDAEARVARETEETRVLPPREGPLGPGSSTESSEDKGGSGSQGSGPNPGGIGEALEPESTADEEREEPASPATKGKTKTKTQTVEAEAEPEPKAETAKTQSEPEPREPGDPSEGDMAATQPAQRLLPGEEEGSFAGSPEAKEEAEEDLVAEGGMPATRLDVRPQDLIADLLPATRQQSREGSESSEALTPYPATRTASRAGGSEDEAERSELRMPPTRHVSRGALGSLARSRRPIEEAMAEVEAATAAGASGDETAHTGQDSPEADAGAEPGAKSPDPDPNPEPERAHAETDAQAEAGSRSTEEVEHEAAEVRTPSPALAGDAGPAAESKETQGAIEEAPGGHPSSEQRAESDSQAALGEPAEPAEREPVEREPAEREPAEHPAEREPAEPVEREPEAALGGAFTRPRSLDSAAGSTDSGAAAEFQEEDASDPESALMSPAIEAGIPPTRSFVIGAHEAPAGFDEVSVAQLRAEGSPEAAVLGEESEAAERETPRGGGGAPPSDGGGSETEDAAEAADSSASDEARGSDGNSA